jgi:hypothetical protein
LSKQIRKILEQDSQKPQKFDKLLKKLAQQMPEFRYLLIKRQIDQKQLLALGWQKWFQYLGWWFARLLMYGTMVAALTLVGLLGKEAVNPLTWALVGAALYYVIIQVFTPMRIRREVEALQTHELDEQLKQLVKQKYEEKTD